MKFNNTRIQVFCKAPIAGEVKTRLKLPPDEAVSVHRQLATRTLNVCLTSRLAPIELWCAPDSQHAFFQQYKEELTLAEQGPGDLGERMFHAMSTTISQGYPTILIGTDCPTIDAEYLELAITTLQAHDAVIGPAEDGGYGLIGLNVIHPATFANIDWGTDAVASATFDALDGLGYDWQVLPTLWDVDRPEDLTRWNALK